MKLYIPLKPKKSDFMIFVTCCSAKGYMTNFQIYEEKSTNNKENSPLSKGIVRMIASLFQQKPNHLHQ
jgi:hypothetical protein